MAQRYALFAAECSHIKNLSDSTSRDDFIHLFKDACRVLTAKERSALFSTMRHSPELMTVDRERFLQYMLDDEFTAGYESYIIEFIITVTSSLRVAREIILTAEFYVDADVIAKYRMILSLREALRDPVKRTDGDDALQMIIDLEQLSEAPDMPEEQRAHCQQVIEELEGK